MERTLRIEELLNEAGWLRRLAASLVADPAQAEDLVQDTWVAALRRPPSAEGGPRPWLRSVVRNLARNAGRDRARREEREDLAREEPVDAGPAALAQAAEAQRLLAEAVTRLEEPLRAVIVLRYFQNLDSSAVGAHLGLPASTVRTRLQRALEELRAALDRRFEGGRESWAALLAPLLADPSVLPAGASAPPALHAPLVAGASSHGSLPLLLAGAACVLATLGAATWRLAGSGGGGRVGASAPFAVWVVAAALSEPQAAPSSSNDERQPLPARSEDESSAVPVTAAIAAAHDAARLSGTVLVDGLPPRWPLRLWLQPDLDEGELVDRLRVGARAVTSGPAAERSVMRKRTKPHDLLLAPEEKGVFVFDGLASDWSGRLVVDDFELANGEPSLAIEAPASGLVLRLRSGPEVVGRIRAADGRPVPGLGGGYELRTGSEGQPASESTTRRFTCRSDGAFRIPSASAGDWAALTIVVEEEGKGYLRHESPTFVPAAGADLGELVLEALRPLAFTVRDTHGKPIEGALARVDGPSFRKRAPLTDADGSGVLAIAPDRAVDVRFSAYAHADRVLRVEPGTSPEVVLEPLAMLALRLLGSVAAEADRVLVSAERPAFVWDPHGWDENAGFQFELGRTKPIARRTPGEAGGRHEYEFAVFPGGPMQLVGVTPDLVLSLEVLDAQGRALEATTLSVAAEQCATLELGVEGAGTAPLLQKAMLRSGPKARGQSR